jgi:hypothetical protein
MCSKPIDHTNRRPQLSYTRFYKGCHTSRRAARQRVGSAKVPRTFRAAGPPRITELPSPISDSLHNIMLFLAAAASALNLPTPRGLDARASTSAAAVPFGRREMIATAGSAFAALATASAASAYDAIPVVEADFAAAERSRKEREALAKKRTESLLQKLAPLEAAKSEAEFVPACDDLALWVISETSIPEGIKVKELVKRITNSLEALPRKSYACEATRTNNGVCYTPGRQAEAAYDALIKQIRKYSVIQLGDYRRVEFQAF